jgi:hypothetical protein
MENGYDNLLDALKSLNNEGYTKDFNLLPNCLFCQMDEIRLFPDEFEIDKYYRFENDTDPADQSIVYAISSIKNNLKGTLVNAYGIYSDPVEDELVRKLHIL